MRSAVQMRGTQENFNAAGKAASNSEVTSNDNSDSQKALEKLAGYKMEPQVKFTAICQTNQCKLIVLSAADFVKQFKNSLEKLI